MQNKKPKTYYEQVMEARASFAKWNQKRLEENEKNPIDWDATVKAGKAVFKKSK